MAIVYLTSDIITNGFAITASTTPAVLNGDILYIADGISVVSKDSRAINLSSSTNTIVIDGSVAAVNKGVSLDAATSNFEYSVDVGSTGKVLAYDFGLYIGSNSVVGVPTGSLISLSNAGEITSLDRSASLIFHSEFATVVNTGTMISLGQDYAYESGLTIWGIVNASVTNTGTIASSANEDMAGAAAIDVTHDSQNVHLVNSGTISGPFYAYYSTASVSENIVNRGLMSGDIHMSDDADGTIRNAGSIDGDVLLGNGNNTFAGRHGEVNGGVFGGDGDDTYIIDDTDIALVELDGEGTDLVKAASSFTLGDFIENLTLLGGGNHRGIGNDLANTITGNLGDNVLGGRLGDDTVSGGDGDDLLYGGGGSDSLVGDDGQDTLRGGFAGDKLEGGGDDDRLLGGNGNDTLSGGNDDDTLLGGAGNDRLNGNNGDDVLIGGLGKDLLFGQNDADSFVFTKVLDSTVGTTRDQIKDFSAADGDLIVLSAIDADANTGADDAFTFIGNAAYSEIAGELRFTSGATNSIIRGDVDGDGVDDFQIFVAGVTTLSVGDFVL